MTVPEPYQPITVAEAARTLTNGNKSKLAALLGVDRSTVAGWENPQRRKKGLCGTIPETYLPEVSKLLAKAASEIVNPHPETELSR